jgi:hypothetical protein
MAVDAKINLTWGDGEHEFRLGLKEWFELQEKCGSGLIEVMDRLATRRWKVEDIREPLRLGLIGAGMVPVDAFTLVKRYVDERPLMESVPVAFAVIAAAIVGAPEDEEAGKKKSEAESDGPDTSQPLGSTEPELPLGSPP